MIILCSVKKILIVGNFETFLEMDENVLSRENCLILASSSAESAIEIHKKENVDLIISDLDMPGGMGGDELSSYIREHLPLKKVSILILCDDEGSFDRRCKTCGANAFLVRPLDSESLNRKVSELLNISEREHMRVLMKVSVEGNVEGETFFSLSENISNTGLLINTEKELQVGDRLFCSFLLQSEQVTIEGEIARIEERQKDQNRYGIKFLDLDPVVSQKIKSFIQGRHSS